MPDAAVTFRPLPLPEFHLLRKPEADGAHKAAVAATDAGAVDRATGFYLERTEEAVAAFGTGIAPTRFQFYFIGVVERSAATCTTGLASFPVGPRVAFFVPPGQIHSSRGWTTRDRGFALSFSDAFFSENLADKNRLAHSPLFRWERPPFLVLSPDEHAETRTLLLALATEWTARRATNAALLRALLHAVVARLEAAALRVQPTKLDLDANARLHARFRERLERDFRREKSPAAYAAALGVHPNHFATAIRAASGLPPGDWIRARIVLEAQCLLAASAQSVKQIAAELGYDDEAYFSRLFKKTVGVSPRDYQLGHG